MVLSHFVKYVYTQFSAYVNDFDCDGPKAGEKYLQNGTGRGIWLSTLVNTLGKLKNDRDMFNSCQGTGGSWFNGGLPISEFPKFLKIWNNGNILEYYKHL